MRKWKEKIRDHKPHGGPAGTVRELVIPAEEIEPRPETTAAGSGPAHRPAATKSLKMSA